MTTRNDDPKTDNTTVPTLTLASGAPVVSNQNSRTAGRRGPVTLDDVHLIEKLAHFNRERIPERVVHAKGSGAFGTFTVTHDISRYTRAKIFSEIGKTTPLLFRFSTVAGERGAADAERDVRGFAMKFYTEDGNWDLVGNNTPIFFIRDPLKFPDFIHTQKRDPRTNLRNPTAMWDFWSRSPESLHQVTILFSDRGLPATYRHMHGFGSHTFGLVNGDGERVWVKFHLKSEQGIRNISDEQSAEIIGQDRESHQADLYDAIERGEYPRWAVKIQVMTEAEARATPFDPFDLTKVWPHKDFPLIDVGVAELNRNPENYFAEIEQSIFSPGNLVPGITASPDRMLQARLFAYGDAHRYRVGVNADQLPVNRPLVQAHPAHRDGAMRLDGNGGRAPNYEPNGFGGAVEDPTAGEPPLPLDGPADRYDHRIGNDDYTQAGDLFRLMDDRQKDLLMTAIANAMASVPDDIKQRQIGHFTKADPAYGAGVAERLGLHALDAAE